MVHACLLDTRLRGHDEHVDDRPIACQEQMVVRNLRE